MVNSISKNKFQAEPDWQEKKRAESKILKNESIMAFILIILCVYVGNIIEGWIKYLLCFVGIIITYLIVSEIFNQSTEHIMERDKEISNLKRQLTCFVCLTSLGHIPESEINRIATAANGPPMATKQIDLSKDDFALINRAWFFWENGFNWQDTTKCINCGHQK